MNLAAQQHGTIGSAALIRRKHASGHLFGVTVTVLKEEIRARLPDEYPNH
ncbi:MAG: hypothetical protein ABIK86_07645 [candidate division WOR-3 bacterium]